MTNICLIEDDPVIRTTLAKILTREGFHVSTYVNGREGLDGALKNNFDLVITDIIMPEVEGIEVIMRLREKKPNMKIIAMSGGGRVGNTDFLEIAKSMGVDHVLHKPVTKTEAMIAINKCVGA